MEAKKADPKTEAAFTQLLALAEQTLKASAKTEQSQAIVLRTDAGNNHAFLTTLEELPTAEDQIVNTLTGEGDTAVSFLAVMWENGCVDLPSCSLRRKLVALDERNRDTLLILQGEGHLNVVALSTTL